MFDFSIGEMVIVAGAALILLGPKELPNALRTMSMVMKNARKLANEFQSGVNEIIREADLEDARKKLNEIQSLNKNNIQSAIEKAVDPTGEVKSALTAEPDQPRPVPEESSTATPAAALPAAETPPADAEDAAVEVAAAQPVTPTKPEPEKTPEAAGAEKS